MAREEEFDPFAPSSGLADDFDGDIIGAEFGYRSSYNNGDTALLLITVKATDGTTIGKAEDDPSETELMYACGNTWEVVDKGEGVQREDGKKMSFNKSSAVWSFIENVMKHDGGKLRAAGDPMRAEGYRGLGGFHWKRIPYKALNGEEKDRLVPVGPSTTSALGDDTEAKAKAPAKAKATATKAPAKAAAGPTAAEKAKAAMAKAAADKAAAEAGAEEGSEAGEDGVRAQLAAIALEVRQGGGDHETFVATVFETIDGSDSDEEIVPLVLDDGAGSVWAESDR